MHTNKAPGANEEAPGAFARLDGNRWQTTLSGAATGFPALDEDTALPGPTLRKLLPAAK